MKKGIYSRGFVYYLLLALLAGGGTAVFAHAAVITKSIPANGEVLAESPPQVTAWFAEELLSGESTLVVYNSQGVQVDNGDGGVDLNDPDHASMIVTLPALPVGTYTVQWHVVLLDGDATDGAFAFGVGEDVVVSPPLVAEPAPETAAADFPLGLAAAGVVIVLLLIGGGLALRKRQS